jgi:hypothetical protein
MENKKARITLTVFLIKEDTDLRLTEDGSAEIIARAKDIPKSVSKTLSDIISTVEMKRSRVYAEDEAAAVLPPEICREVIMGIRAAKYVVSPSNAFFDVSKTAAVVEYADTDIRRTEK